MHLSSLKLSMKPRLNNYTKEFFFFQTSTFVFSLQLLVLRTIFDKRFDKKYFFETSLFFTLTNPSPDKERDRSREVCRSIDDERDVELDGNDLLDLDSEHNDDDFESDLLSD